MASKSMSLRSRGIGVHPGECICWSVGRSTDVNIRGELGHEIEVGCDGLGGRR